MQPLRKGLHGHCLGPVDDWGRTCLQRTWWSIDLQCSRLRARDVCQFGASSAGSTAVLLCCTWIQAQSRLRWTY